MNLVEELISKNHGLVDGDVAEDGVGWTNRSIAQCPLP